MTLAELLEQRAQIEAQIAAAKEAEARAAREQRAEIITAVKATIIENNITAAELGFMPAAAPKLRRVAAVKTPKPTARAKVSPKYTDGTNTWSGRGLQPRWLRAALAGGATLERFKIAD